MKFSELPKLREPLENGVFAGITTKPDGTHCAVVLMSDQGANLTWDEALDWTKNLGAELPTRPIASMLFANIKGRLPRGWHWTSEEHGASYAWLCHFFGGNITGNRKIYESSAVAVRYIEIKN